MPVHDWTRVEDGIFHDFHTTWIGAIRSALNEGVLPKGYYALAEQHFGRPIADILTLHAGPDGEERGAPHSIDTGGVAVAEVPPRVRRKQSIEPLRARQRSLAIRHVSGHRLIAVLEIISPSNKDRAQHVQDFVNKADEAIAAGVHLLLIDLLPPGPHDATGMHGALLEQIDSSAPPYDLPADEPLTLASYAAGPRIEACVEHLAVGMPLPEMPLFLSQERYVNVPLEPTYQATYRGVPEFWRDVIEGRTPTS